MVLMSGFPGRNHRLLEGFFGQAPGSMHSGELSVSTSLLAG